MVQRDSEPPLTYPLRDIPREAWRKAQLRAMKDGYALRHVLLAMLEEYAAGRAVAPRRLERYKQQTNEAKRKGAAKRRKKSREG